LTSSSVRSLRWVVLARRRVPRSYLCVFRPCLVVGPSSLDRVSLCPSLTRSSTSTLLATAARHLLPKPVRSKKPKALSNRSEDAVIRSAGMSSVSESFRRAFPKSSFQWSRVSSRRRRPNAAAVTVFSYASRLTIGSSFASSLAQSPRRSHPSVQEPCYTFVGPPLSSTASSLA